jgi:hypothetical protein
MIVDELEQTIVESQQRGEFIYPFYPKYCFSNIPSTILDLFGIQTRRPRLPPELYENAGYLEDASKIVLLVIDAFGYHQWLRSYRDYSFFDTLSQKGILLPLTSVFPSTTAAALTTLNTGLTPQEHAVHEWYVYLKEIDMIIKTLPFTPLGGEGQDELLALGIDPTILYEGNTVYQTLAHEGVQSFTLVKASYAHSCYSTLIHQGSTIIPFFNHADLVVRLRKLLEDEEGPAYIYAYVDDLDIIEHIYGPYTDEYSSQLSLLSYALQGEFLGKLEKRAAQDTLLLVTSDHGQVNIAPNETIYLNNFPELEQAFLKGTKGNRVLPTGSARDVFLHVEADKRGDMQWFLSDKLAGKAQVMSTKEAIELELFGMGKPSKEFFDRVGDLLILPYNNHTVWYEHVKGKKLHFLGYHGGLTKEEMLVPFALARLSELLNTSRRK